MIALRPLPLNNFYCDVLRLYNIVIPIKNLMTSVNLKKAGKASRNIVLKKSIHVVISFPVVFGPLVFCS